MKREGADVGAMRLAIDKLCQGEAIKAVISQCNVPLSKISRMALHNVIKGTHGFYGLDVKYKNGQAQLYIADDGCSTRVVASDFVKIQ